MNAWSFRRDKLTCDKCGIPINKRKWQHERYHKTDYALFYTIKILSSDSANFAHTNRVNDVWREKWANGSNGYNIGVAVTYFTYYVVGCSTFGHTSTRHTRKKTGQIGDGPKYPYIWHCCHDCFDYHYNCLPFDLFWVFSPGHCRRREATGSGFVCCV